MTALSGLMTKNQLQGSTASDLQSETRSGDGTDIVEVPLRIRPLIPRDAEAFHYLRLRCIAADPFSFSVLLEEEQQMSRLQCHSLLERFYRADNAALWGAFCRDYLVGMIGLEPLLGPVRQHRAIVTSLCVLPEYRGQGIGRALVAYLVGYARSSPVLESLVLEVSETAPQAFRLYFDAGFRVSGLEPKALAFGDRRLDLIRMSLPLRTSP